MPPTSCDRPQTRPRPAWPGVLGGLLVGAMLMVGCSKKGSPASEAPSDAVAAEAAEPAFEPETRALDDGLARHELELQGYEDALLSSGIELPAAVTQARAEAGLAHVPATDGGGDTAGARCERICGLATNICSLRERICSLADGHDDDVRYARACGRATLDCERATEACDGCEG